MLYNAFNYGYPVSFLIEPNNLIRQRADAVENFGSNKEVTPGAHLPLLKTTVRNVF